MSKRGAIVIDLSSVQRMFVQGEIKAQLHVIAKNNVGLFNYELYCRDSE